MADPNPYTPPRSTPPTEKRSLLRWRVVVAVLLYGFGGLMVAGALFLIAASCLRLLLGGEPVPPRLILAVLGHLAGGLLWIGSGTAFRKHRSLRGVLLLIVGYLLGAGSAMLMQAAVD